MLLAISDFVDRIPNGSISLVKLRSYLYTLITQSYEMITRNNKFVTNPLPTSGLDYINGMLIRVDMDYLLKFRNDIERFRKIEKVVSSASFSSYIYQNPMIRKGFIKSSSLVAEEYILPTTDVNAFDMFPFESENPNDWMTLRPFRMLSCPSLEFSCDNLTSRIRYDEYPPLEAIFSLNIPMLLLQYTKLRLLEGENPGEGTNRYPFIYKTCILPLVFDSYRSWLMEIYSTMAITVSLDSERLIDSNAVSIGNRAMFARAGFEKTMTEVRQLFINCRNGKIKADMVMQSLGLRYGYNLIDEVHFLRDSHYVSGETQKYWLTFIKEYELMKLILQIYSLNPDSARYKELIKILKIRLRRLKAMKFWNAISNPANKHLVKEKFDDLSAYVM